MYGLGLGFTGIGLTLEFAVIGLFFWVHVNESGSGSMGADQDKESLGWAYNLGPQGQFWCWMGQELIS